MSLKEEREGDRREVEIHAVCYFTLQHGIKKQLHCALWKNNSCSLYEIQTVQKKQKFLKIWIARGNHNYLNKHPSRHV